ncbi:hypothetical protein TVAG_359960 [Trichomonas vaginalis G3]|uniref:DUF3447 domain-containing protein n=1 Tax=Trichomonas vaginalis (strain ATCC PRA-98 / G3) TaxID=412133 RepID=A2DTB5_TRIV3|nr:Ankyrin repeat family [Trichomonas vaginalis G3]EAY16387.1 hypothetical protein TVAG_359960 [Trichomonas vaginalis G3]KAI5488385.1 Ankyrin repeat family [Trichomonas vaginalis G3]|eukprot:XP_001328610.1 hypothetical protein [Trichomonas vaginalis G3]
MIDVQVFDNNDNPNNSDEDSSSYSEEEEAESGDSSDQDETHFNRARENKIKEYNGDLMNFNLAEFTIPDEFPDSLREKFEIEQKFREISEDIVEELADKLEEFVKKSPSNQLFVIQIIDSVAIAKPKLVQLLAKVFSRIVQYVPIDSNLAWESGYLNNYLSKVGLNSHKHSGNTETDLGDDDILYPKDSIQYFTTIDDLESFQDFELKRSCQQEEEELYFVEHEGDLLCLAARFGSIRIFKYLLISGNIEITQNTFICAVKGGNIEIVRHCLKYNNDPLESMRTAIHCNNYQLVEWMIDEYQILPLIYAPLERNTLRYFFPLLDRIQFCTRQNISSAISYAFKSGYNEIGIYLLRKFAVPNMDYFGILMWMAIGQYKDEILEFLDLPITKQIMENYASSFISYIVDNCTFLIKDILKYEVIQNYFSAVLRGIMYNKSALQQLIDCEIDLGKIYKEKYGENMYNVIAGSVAFLCETAYDNLDIFVKVLEKCDISENFFQELVNNCLSCGCYQLFKFISSYEKFSSMKPYIDIDKSVRRIRGREIDLETFKLALSLGSNYVPNREESGLHSTDLMKFNKLCYIELFRFFAEKNLVNFRNRKNRTSFHIMIHNKLYDLAMEILNTFKGIDLNAKDSKGLTPLILAVSYFKNGRTELFNLIKLMISYGADPKIVSSKGKSALDYAESVPKKSELLQLFEN